MKIKVININKIKPDPEQPRRKFDLQSIDELAKSIKKDGLLQPISVRQVNNHYKIIHGERRYRACKTIALKEIPAIIQNLNDEDAFHSSIIENIQREQMTPIEEAKAFKKYIELGYTQNEVANKISKSRSYVLNRLQLIELSPKIIKMINSGQLSSSHIKPFNKLKNNVARLINHDKGYKLLQEKFYSEHKYRSKISVKELDEWVNNIRNIFLSSIIASYNKKGDEVIDTINIGGIPFKKTYKNVCQIYDLHIRNIKRRDIHYLLNITLDNKAADKKISEIYKVYEDLEESIFDNNLDLEEVWNQRGMDKDNLKNKTLDQITNEIKYHQDMLKKIVAHKNCTLDDLFRDLSVLYNMY